MTQMEVTSGLCTNYIQRYQIIGNGVLALLPNVWAQTPPTYRLVVPQGQGLLTIMYCPSMRG